MQSDMGNGTGVRIIGQSFWFGKGRCRRFGSLRAVAGRVSWEHEAGDYEDGEGIGRASMYILAFEEGWILAGIERERSAGTR